MNIDVFVSHHTNSSLHIVEGIVNKLEANGIRCWYAPRDTEGTYASSISKALNSCSLFLLILNRPASESFHVLNEIDMVTKRLTRNENVKIVPFHVADDEIGLDAQYYLGRIHWIDAMTPPMYQRIDELVEHISTLLGKESISAEQTPSAPQVPSYRLIGKLPQARDIFDGREHLLEQIETTFSGGKRALFLEGIGGIGKSELAKQYALKHKEEYDTIIFATYVSSLSKLFCDPNAIAIENLEQAPDEEDETYFQRKLQILQSIANERTLLIIDNFDVDDDPDLKQFLEGTYRVLITTRNAHPGYSSIKVHAIQDLDVLFRIFEQNYGTTLSEEEYPYIEKMFRLVEYHTYTIELIAKQMEASFLSAYEMADLLEKGRLQTHITETVAGRNDMNTAFGHICSVFNTSNLNDHDKQILRYLSIMGTGGVPAARFKEWAGLSSFEEINTLIRRSWIRRESGQKISLHPLVKEVVHQILTPTFENVHEFVVNASKFCFSAWFRDCQENIAVANNILSILDYFGTPDGNDPLVFAPLTSFLWQVGKFDESIKYSVRLYHACADAYGKDSMHAGEIAKLTGGCYFNSRRLEESIAWYKLGLESMLASGAKESEDLALAYEKVARCYTWEYEQDFEKAKQYFGEALRIRLLLWEKLKNGEVKSMLSPFEKYDANLAHIRISESYMEMGRMYQMCGDYKQALAYVTRQAEIIEAERPDDTASAAYILYDKGVCHYHLGKQASELCNSETAQEEWLQAEKLFSEALALNLKRRGTLAIDTIDNQEYLADTYAAMKRYGEASNAYMAVVTMLENLLGPGHPRIQHVKEKMNFEAL